MHVSMFSPLAGRTAHINLNSLPVLLRIHAQNRQQFWKGKDSQLHRNSSTATPSRQGFRRLGTVALLIYVVQLLAGESDLTIRTLASQDYEGAAFICAVIDN